MKRSLMMVFAGLVMWAMACGTGGDEPEKEAERDAALHIMVDADGAVDVEKARLMVRTCGGDEVLSREASIGDWSHEGMRPLYLSDDDHLFVEEYLQVAAGCYDVEMVFFDDQSRRSSICATAYGAGIEVTSEQNVEVIVYGRCEEDAQDPTVNMLEFTPSAFAGCEADIEVCAQVRGDGGDVQFVWDRVGGEPVDQPWEGDVEADGRYRTQCTRWRPREHGEVYGRLQAISGTAEVTRASSWGTVNPPQTMVLFGEVHEVLFGMYVECRL